jgi:ribosomal protein L24
MNKKIHVKKDDTVVLLTGKYEEKYDKNGNITSGSIIDF